MIFVLNFLEKGPTKISVFLRKSIEHSQRHTMTKIVKSLTHRKMRAEPRTLKSVGHMIGARRAKDPAKYLKVPATIDNRVGDVCKKFSEDKNRSLDAAEDESAKVSKKGFLLTIDDPYGVATRNK